jgi:hypothetical protein
VTWFQFSALTQRTLRGVRVAAIFTVESQSPWRLRREEPQSREESQIRTTTKHQVLVQFGRLKLSFFLCETLRLALRSFAVVLCRLCGWKFWLHLNRTVPSIRHVTRPSGSELADSEHISLCFRPQSWVSILTTPIHSTECARRRCPVPPLRHKSHCCFL